MWIIVLSIDYYDTSYCGQEEYKKFAFDFLCHVNYFEKFLQCILLSH